jgi:hypothetical protein
MIERSSVASCCTGFVEQYSNCSPLVKALRMQFFTTSGKLRDGRWTRC